MKYLLYGAINSKNILSETIYSILSLFRISREEMRNYKIVIVTTFKKEMFGPLRAFNNVFIEQISSEIANNWINADQTYVFKVKIFILKYFFSKYKGNVVFVDSDTVFIKSPCSIFDIIKENKAVMNFRCRGIEEVVDSYRLLDTKDIEDNDARARLDFYRSIKQNREIPSLIMSGQKYIVPNNFHPYNSGLIGMLYKDRGLLDQVLDVCLSLCKNFYYICSEEFAFSLVFALNGKETISVNDIIYHYLFEKRTRLLVAYLLDYFHLDDKSEFEKFISEIDPNSQEINCITLQELPYYMSFKLSHMLSTEQKERINTYEENFESFKMNLLEAKKIFKKLNI